MFFNFRSTIKIGALNTRGSEKNFQLLSTERILIKFTWNRDDEDDRELYESSQLTVNVNRKTTNSDFPLSSLRMVEIVSSVVVFVRLFTFVRDEH